MLSCCHEPLYSPLARVAVELDELLPMPEMKPLLLLRLVLELVLSRVVEDVDEADEVDDEDEDEAELFKYEGRFKFNKPMSLLALSAFNS